MLENPLNKSILQYMYHVHCTIAPVQTLNPSKMVVTPSSWMSGSVFPMMYLHVLNITISFYILVCLNLCKPALVHRSLCYVMLGYVTSEIMFTFMWVGNTAVGNRSFTYYYFVAKMVLYWQLRQLHFFTKKLKNVNISSVLCFNIKEFSVTKCWFLPKRELCPRESASCSRTLDTSLLLHNNKQNLFVHFLHDFL